MKSLIFSVFLAVALTMLVSKTDGNPVENGVSTNASSTTMRSMGKEETTTVFDQANKTSEESKEASKPVPEITTQQPIKSVNESEMAVTEDKLRNVSVSSQTTTEKQQVTAVFTAKKEEPKSGSGWMIFAGLGIFAVAALSVAAGYTYLKR